MAFKKIDSDAVSSTDSKPVDAGVLFQEADNVEEAHTDRTARVSYAYPAGNRPVWSGVHEMFEPIGYHRVRFGVDEVTLRFRGIATATAAATAISAQLVAVDEEQGIVYGYDDAGYTAITHNASAQEVDVTLDTTHLQGQRLLFGVVQYSDEITGTGSEDNNITPSVAVSHSGRRVDLSSIGAFSWDNDKRWKLKFGEGVDDLGADTGIEEEPPDYHPVQLIRSLGSDLYSVAPSISGTMEEVYSRIKFTVIEIGRFEVYGWALIESSTLTRADLKPMFRSAKIPSAHKFSALYGREFLLFRDRVRVFHMGGSPRIGKTETSSGDVVNDYNAYYEYSASEEDVAAAWVGTLDQWRLNSRTATLAYRQQYLITGVLVLVHHKAEEDGTQLLYDIDLGARINAYDTGAETWDDDETTQTLRDYYLHNPVAVTPSFEAPARVNESANILNYRVNGEGNLAWHHLRGALFFKDVRQNRIGFHAFGFTLREDDSYKADTSRMLTLRIQGSAASANGFVYPGSAPPIVHLLTWSVENLDGVE
jgi:hypothetical protein